MSIDGIIDGILQREGSEYTNVPGDRGGPTKYGITLATLRSYRGYPQTAADVAALDLVEARAIYRKCYVEDPGFMAIPDSVLVEILVDCAVNHGQHRAVRWLQRAIGAEPDGVIGPVTLMAITGHDFRTIRASVLQSRASAYAAILQDPSQWKFAAGWMNRLGEFIGKI